MWVIAIISLEQAYGVCVDLNNGGQVIQHWSIIILSDIWLRALYSIKHNKKN